VTEGEEPMPFNQTPPELNEAFRRRDLTLIGETLKKWTPQDLASLIRHGETENQVVALKATDDEETAVGVFKREDRIALPVTDTAGILIGIFTGLVI
jgi:Mg/Co/Ni transporter MgtE